MRKSSRCTKRAAPVRHSRVSNVDRLFPGLSVSDSWKRIFPGMSMSNRWIFWERAQRVGGGYTNAVGVGARLRLWRRPERVRNTQTFWYLRISSPSGPNTAQVLYSFPPSSSGIEPVQQQGGGFSHSVTWTWNMFGLFANCLLICVHFSTVSTDPPAPGDPVHLFYFISDSNVMMIRDVLINSEKKFPKFWPAAIFSSVLVSIFWKWKPIKKTIKRISI